MICFLNVIHRTVVFGMIAYRKYINKRKKVTSSHGGHCIKVDGNLLYSDNGKYHGNIAS